MTPDPTPAPPSPPTPRGGWRPWRSSAAGFVAAAALFYPFTSEFCHCQRDPWMLLPAAVAARLRLRQLGRATAATRGLFGPAALEGFVWGLAVWLKPHVVVPAAAAW